MTALETPITATVAEGSSEQDNRPADGSYGWTMLIAFAAAVIGISLAVCILGLLPGWWVLGAVCAVHLGVTAMIMKVVLNAFGPESESYPDLAHVEAAAPVVSPEPSFTAAPAAPLALAAQH